MKMLQHMTFASLTLALVVAHDSGDHASGKASGSLDDKGGQGDTILGVPKDRFIAYATGGLAALIGLLLLFRMLCYFRRQPRKPTQSVPVVINNIQQPPTAKLGHSGPGGVVRGQEVRTRDVESGHAAQTAQVPPVSSVYPSPYGI